VLNGASTERKVQRNQNARALPRGKTLRAGAAGRTTRGLAGDLITLFGGLAYCSRWWPSFLVLAPGVALILLLAPDAYVVFGLLFDALILAASVIVVSRIVHRPSTTARLHLRGQGA
jgi:hypothetical protein